MVEKLKEQYKTELQECWRLGKKAQIKEALMDETNNDKWDIDNFRYDYIKLDYEIALGIDRIYMKLDDMVMRETLSENDADLIKESL